MWIFQLWPIFECVSFFYSDFKCFFPKISGLLWDIARPRLPFFSFLTLTLVDKVTRTKCLCDKDLVSHSQPIIHPMLSIPLPEKDQSLEDIVVEYFTEPEVIKDECFQCGKLVTIEKVPQLVNPQPAIVSLNFFKKDLFMK